MGVGRGVGVWVGGCFVGGRVGWGGWVGSGGVGWGRVGLGRIEPPPPSRDHSTLSRAAVRARACKKDERSGQKTHTHAHTYQQETNHQTYFHVTTENGEVVEKHHHDHQRTLTFERVP